jgi:carbon-monoxide dehydrogenase medium subunit
MTLPPFELHRPTTVEEATELASRYGEDAAFYCGGTELLLLLKLGFASFGHLVDLKRIEELAGVRVENGGLVIGATVTHRALERSELVEERLPALAAMERRVANVRVRQVGTLGGNLCFSDPHSDPSTFLLAADAEVEASRRGWPADTDPRSSPALRASLVEGELLTSVHSHAAGGAVLAPRSSPSTSVRGDCRVPRVGQRRRRGGARCRRLGRSEAGAVQARRRHANAAGFDPGRIS